MAACFFYWEFVGTVHRTVRTFIDLHFRLYDLMFESKIYRNDNNL